MILTRNGYIYSLLTSTDLVELELYIYTGTQTTSRPASATAVLLAEPQTPIDGGSSYVRFDIAPYVNDEINIEVLNNSALSSRTTNDEGVWVDWRYRTYTSGSPSTWGIYTRKFALPGWQEYTFNTNMAPVTDADEPFLISDRLYADPDFTPQYPTFYIPSGERLVVACNDFDSVDEGTFYNGTTHTTAVATPGGATTSTSTVLYVQEPVALDTTEMYRFDGVSTYTKLFNVERVSDPNNQASKVTFVNRNGVFQDMWFFGRTNKNFSVTGITAKRDTKFYNSFSPDRHQYLDFFKNGRERITINSGWVTEANNEWFKELLMSEQIWWDDPDQLQNNPVPVRIVGNNLAMKTQRWDRVINYTIELEVATDYAFN